MRKGGYSKIYDIQSLMKEPSYCEHHVKLLSTTVNYLGLAYCRHLRTVRTHLSRLIESDPIEENIVGPVDETFWQRCRTEKSVR